MTQDEIIEMARQAGLRTHIPFWSDREVSVALEAFAKLVAAKERQACAQECVYLFFTEDSPYHYIPDARGALKEAQSSIMARSEE